MASLSPEQCWKLAFKEEVASLVTRTLLPNEIFKINEELKGKQEQGFNLDTTDATTQIVINEGKGLQEIWEEYVEPGLVEVANHFGSAGIIVSSTKQYLDNPDVARRGARHAAPVFRLLQENPDRSLLEISKSALRIGLQSLDQDPSGFHLIKAVHNPDYFGALQRITPYPHISIGLVRYGATRYRNLYNQLINAQGINRGK